MEYMTLDATLQSVIEKRKALIVNAFNGRTQKYVSDQTGIPRHKIQLWVNGFLQLTTEDLNKINKMLGTDFRNA